MNTLSTLASTIFSVSALGATILFSAPAKANCGDIENAYATQPNKWFQAFDVCSHSDGTAALLNYSIGFSTNSQNTGAGFDWMNAFQKTGGSYTYADATCVWCANVGEMCGSFTPPQTQTGNPLPFTFPPSSLAICPSGDAAYEAEAFVIVR